MLLETELKTKTMGVLNVDTYKMFLFGFENMLSRLGSQGLETTPKAKNEFIFYVRIS